MVQRIIFYGKDGVESGIFKVEAKFADG